MREDEAPKPWERQPGETEVGFAYFVAFRDMAYPEGPGGTFKARNVVKLAERLGVDRGSLTRFSGLYGWPTRAAAYDREIDRITMRAKGKAIEAASRRHLRLMEKASAILETELGKWESKGTEDTAVPIGTLKETLDGIANLVKTERLVLGASTENQAQGESSGFPSDGWDLESLSLEELERLDEIRRKAKGAEPAPLDESEPSE